MVPDWRSRTNTSEFTPLKSLLTRLPAVLMNTTKRPSALIEVGELPNTPGAGGRQFRCAVGTPVDSPADVVCKNVGVTVVVVGHEIAREAGKGNPLTMELITGQSKKAEWLSPLAVTPGLPLAKYVWLADGCRTNASFRPSASSGVRVPSLLVKTTKRPSTLELQGDHRRSNRSCRPR